MIKKNKFPSSHSRNPSNQNTIIYTKILNQTATNSHKSIRSTHQNQYIVSQFVSDEQNMGQNQQRAEIGGDHEYNLKLIENISRNVVSSGQNTVSMVNYLVQYVKQLEKDKVEMRKMLDRYRCQNRILADSLLQNRIQTRIDYEQYQKLHWEYQILKQKETDI